MILPDTDPRSRLRQDERQNVSVSRSCVGGAVKFLPETGKKAGRGDAVLGRGG